MIILARMLVLFAVIVSSTVSKEPVRSEENFNIGQYVVVKQKDYFTTSLQKEIIKFTYLLHRDIDNFTKYKIAIYKSIKPVVKNTNIVIIDNRTFFDGYNDAGGQNHEIMHRIVKCESGWLWWKVNPDSGAMGLAQFLPSTWYNVASETGYWDWTNEYHQGFNAGWLENNAGLEQWDCYQ